MTQPVRRSAFDDVPEIYDRARPEYPPALFDDLFAYLNGRKARPHPQIIEVGPGTGQATRALLDRDARVTAVELGPKLAAFLAQKYHDHANLRVLNVAFEDVPLPEGTWDAVVSATAFHWVAAEARMRKPFALLAPGGVLAIIDTIQVRSEADRGYFERSHPIYLRYWPDQPYRDAPTPDVVPPIFEEMSASRLFEDIRLYRYRWDQTYDVDAYLDLVRSYSNTYEVEWKGSTSIDSLPAPSTDPTSLSAGYRYKAPGVADKSDAKKWEVSTYVYTPGAITVYQGDTVTLRVFAVNGDTHGTSVVAPDGSTVVQETVNRGREDVLVFKADRTGTYRLVCADHAPTMQALITVLPRT